MDVADASIAVVVPSIANLLPEIVNAGEYTGSDFTVLFDTLTIGYLPNNIICVGCVGFGCKIYFPSLSFNLSR